MPITEYRQKVLDKIALLEREGIFDKDCEDDPPSRALKPGEVDYLHRKLGTRIRSRFTNRASFSYFRKMIRDGAIVIDEVVGSENLERIRGGAIITANHFSPFDSIPIHLLVKERKRKYLWTIIREGNYFFPGLYGKFFRNCNTLPLGSDIKVMQEMYGAVDTLLKKGEFILIYPEQSLWWNYRKPKPVKPGAYQFAISANVPVLPTFITMRDTDRIDSDGLPVQAYTLHVLEPIYPDPSASRQENLKRMKEENENAWKEVYESVYGIPLVYTTEK